MGGGGGSGNRRKCADQIGVFLCGLLNGGITDAESKLSATLDK